MREKGKKLKSGEKNNTLQQKYEKNKKKRAKKSNKAVFCGRFQRRVGKSVKKNVGIG